MKKIIEENKGISKLLKTKGITLIALTITLIVMLILTGVTIAGLKNNGLLNNTKLASEKFKNSQLEENGILESYQDEMENYDGTFKVDFTFEKSDSLFAVKSKIIIKNNKSNIDFNKCKYTYTNSDKAIGNDINLYKRSITNNLTEVEEIAPSGEIYLHILLTNKNGQQKEFISSNSVKNESEISYDYIGTEQEANLLPGKYKLEVWGAQGGTYNSSYFGGYGGYSSGSIDLNDITKLYINVGGQGSYTNSGTVKGGYNGGGIAYSSRGSGFFSCSGGGATHIGLKSGLLSSLSLNDAIIIGAGGGGSTYRNGDGYSYMYGGNGGGIKGNTSTGTSNWRIIFSTGATQTQGGTGGCLNGDWGAKQGLFGTAYNTNGGFGTQLSGGGGGLYGGGSGNDTAGGGGSGYIGNSLLTNKHMAGCNVSTSNDEDTKTISVTTHSNTATADCAKEGNGFCKITNMN